MSTCIVKRNSIGRLVPMLPTGEEIPGIERGSIEYFQDDKLEEVGLVRVQLDLLVWEKDIEGGLPITQEEESEEPVSKVNKRKRTIGWLLVAIIWGAIIYNFAFLMPFSATLMMLGSFVVFCAVSALVIWLFN